MHIQILFLDSLNFLKIHQNTLTLKNMLLGVLIKEWEGVEHLMTDFRGQLILIKTVVTDFEKSDLLLFFLISR